LQYRIQYRKGAENAAADALSHRSHTEVLAAVSTVQHQWLEELTLSYQSHSKACELLTQLAVSPDAVPPYTLSQGLIHYKGRIWLGSSTPIQQRVIQAFHSSPVGGHSGVPATYSHIRQLFFWQGMRADI
jgi:hypothetical protein